MCKVIDVMTRYMGYKFVFYDSFGKLISDDIVKTCTGVIGYTVIPRTKYIHVTTTVHTGKGDI